MGHNPWSNNKIYLGPYVLIFGQYVLHMINLLFK